MIPLTYHIRKLYTYHIGKQYTALVLRVLATRHGAGRLAVLVGLLCWQACCAGRLAVLPGAGAPLGALPPCARAAVLLPLMLLCRCCCSDCAWRPSLMPRPLMLLLRRRTSARTPWLGRTPWLARLSLRWSRPLSSCSLARARWLMLVGACYSVTLTPLGTSGW